MPRKLVTGNHVAGHMLAMAGEANRNARGACAGAYPITPQTEVVEYLRAFPFTKGSVVPVESEHSAMAVCIGASLAGARTFTASSANGLSYMNENVFNAGYYRLPVVLMAVNRTLGPPWNIWVDQGDSLALRDAPMLQFYCEGHQDLADTTLLAFRISEDPRVMMPALVAYDGFIISHTTAGVDFPEQEQVDRYLPPLKLPHQLRHEHPLTIGGLAWPHESSAHRLEIQRAMEQVPAVLEEARREFAAVFGRTPEGAITCYETEGAETILIATNSIASTVRDAVAERRACGEKIGMVKLRLFRPVPRAEILAAVGGAKRVGVIERDHSPGSGGVFWGEVAVSMRERSDVLLQDYLVGLGGGDVTPPLIAEIIDDLTARKRAEDPIWKGVAA